MAQRRQLAAHHYRHREQQLLDGRRRAVRDDAESAEDPESNGLQWKENVVLL